MVWLLKDNEVDMNEAPCRFRLFMETEAKIRERLPLKRWRIDSGGQPKTTQKDEERGKKGGKERQENSMGIKRQSANLKQRYSETGDKCLSL